MRLKRIGLMLSADEQFEGMFSSDFLFKCNFIGNYLTRALRNEKLETSIFNSIMIVGCTKKKPNYFFEKFLVIEIPFDRKKYDSTPTEELPEFFTKMYIEGIEKAKHTHSIPYGFLMDKLNLLKKNGYKNEWAFKSKTFKSIGIKATLFCKMTMNYFSLSLILEKDGKVLFNEEVINTKPSETQFYDQFKDVVYEYGDIIILNRADANIYSIRWLPSFKSNLSGKGLNEIIVKS